MATERQIEANRRNAQRSTGPRTDAGKSISRHNSLRHGLTGNSMLFLPGEDPAMYTKLKEAFIDRLQPQGPVEFNLVANLAAIFWRLRRAEGYDAAILAWKQHYLDHCQIANTRQRLQRSLSSAGRNPVEPEPGDLVAGQEFYVLGRALDAVLVQGDHFAKLSRYESHLARHMEHMMDLLHKLKSERPVPPQNVNAPTSQK